MKVELPVDRFLNSIRFWVWVEWYVKFASKPLQQFCALAIKAPTKRNMKMRKRRFI